MTDPTPNAAGCTLVANADCSIMEIVVDDPTRSAWFAPAPAAISDTMEVVIDDPVRQLQEITSCGLGVAKDALAQTVGNIEAAVEVVRLAGTPKPHSVRDIVSGRTQITDDLPVSYPGEKRSSPSKYKSIELSPAYEEDKTRDEHPLTARGKAMHAAVETGDDSLLEEDEVHLVAMCRKVRDQIIPRNATVRREIKLPVIGSDYGFLDQLALLPRKAIIIDYKFAFNKQEDAETNPQVQGYGLSVFRTFPYIETVDVYLLYPRLDVVDMATFRREDVGRISARIMAIKRAHDVATPATCRWSESTCTYCRHLVDTKTGVVCPTAGPKLLPIATRYAESHAMPLPDLDFDSVVDPNHWRELLAAAPVFESVADSIKRHAKEFVLSSGMEIPGYDLTPVSGKRTISSPQLAHEIATGKFGITYDDFLRAVKVSAKDLIDLAKETAPRGKKGLRAQEFEDALRDAGALSVGADYHQLKKTKVI